jgi:hypothetical protein
MSRFTPQQKQALVALAKQYSPEVHRVITRGDVDEVTIESREEATLLEAFADSITTQVMRDYPDHAGRDEDIHADAELSVHMIADVLADYRTRFP